MTGATSEVKESGRGRPRRAETDRRIHESALALLRERGPAAVTVEAVAASAGVAKTTIYRRYDDREAVLRAALTDAIRPPAEPVGVTARAKIAWAMGQLWHQMADVLGRGGLSAIVGNTQPAFTELFRGVLAPYTTALVDLVRTDVAAGELRGDLDPDTAVTLLMGAYLGELVRRGEVDEQFGERCVDLMWTAMSAQRG